MNQRPTLREQIDACRADSDDLHLPEHAADLAELKAGVQQNAEIRALWERSQHADRTIRGAMQDVPLPAGLEQRLLAAVQAAQEQSLAFVEKATVAETPGQGVDSVASAKRAPITSRRTWVWGTFGLTAAALILAAIVGNQFLNPADEAVTKDQLASQVQDWLQAVSKVKWDATATAKRFPKGSLNGGVSRSGSVASSQGTIFVYDVTLSTGSSRAMLLVLPTMAKYPVDSLPPFTSVPVSGAWDVVAWQKDGALYVLAVSGTDSRLDQFIRHQPIG